MQIFINYRRRDTRSAAGRLTETLRLKLPGATIFLDTEDPIPGPFPLRIARGLRSADVMLALIGHQWFDENGEVVETEDWVRREITAALETGVTVIPVMVDGAPLPPREKLPALMRPLVDQEAAPLRTGLIRDWNSDIDALVRQICHVAPPERLQERDEQPYVLAIYNALVRWSIYEAELGWRVTLALAPVVTVLAGAGAGPTIHDHASRSLWICGAVASALGLLIAVLWHAMVGRTRLFFKYRVDSANAIELAFPVPPERAHLFRTKLHHGYVEQTSTQGSAPQLYQFSPLQQITMTTAMKVITLSYVVLLLILFVVDSVGAIRAV